MKIRLRQRLKRFARATRHFTWDGPIMSAKLEFQRRELSDLRGHHEKVVAERDRLVALAQAQVVRLAFRLELGREPSLDEESYYSGVLNSGKSADDLLEEIKRNNLCVAPAKRDERRI